MQTVDKALKLLNLFSVQQPEIGLSELARMAGFDKATTRRFLLALLKHQYVEQNPDTKHYRLGTGFLHLAKIRESVLPLDSILQTALQRLSQATGETTHAALLTDGQLATLGVVLSSKANRVHLNLGECLPLHATASGQVMLAFTPGCLQKQLSQPLVSYTPRTVTNPEQLELAVKLAAQRGYGMVGDGYEAEVTGIAVPFFDAQGIAIGTLAIATPSVRMTSALQAQICTELFTEARWVTETLGGVLPKTFPHPIQQTAA